MNSNQHKLPVLPYELDALHPYISKETMEYHYGKHHQTYVTNLNNLLKGSNLEGEMSLQKIIVSTQQGPIFNNAAQVYNHNFYWFGLGPNKGGEPSGKLVEAINLKWGSFKNFKDEFNKCALATFGSGWAWLVQRSEGNLDIVSTSNAGTPLTSNLKPLLTCDVWEHAYYIDYRNSRANYLEAYWNLVDWSFVSSNYENEHVWHHNQY
jgi:Fe-Mn family superoxide dismutase